ncbi:unnamed protein product, partial [Staurois parvus]
MSVTPNQFPSPVSECPPQSRYKSLIAAITSIKTKFQYIYTAICKHYNFHVNQLIYTYWDF